MYNENEKFDYKPIQNDNANEALNENASDIYNREQAYEASASDISERVGEHVEREINNAPPINLEEDDRKVYSDANYILSEEAPTTPRRYYTMPEKEAAPPPPPQEPKKDRATSRVLTGVLAGVLVGAVIGVGVTGLMDNQNPASAENTPTAITTPTPAPAITINNTSGGELHPTEIYAEAVQEVVGIRTEFTTTNYFGQQTTNAVSGTGFIVSEDGYIMTNEHVIEDAYANNLEVNVIMYDGTTYVAEIIGFEDSDSDIAVLKIDAEGLNAVQIADSDEILVGEDVYAVGNPLGELTYTMTEGMVSALDREITSLDNYTGVVNTIDMLQISAAVNSGNSGGPIYNSRGEVIGVVTAKYGGGTNGEDSVEGLGFAIPINDAVAIANDLIEKGYVSGKPYMGVLIDADMDAKIAAYYGVPMGAFIETVIADTCAERAGLQVGDIITGIDDKEIKGRNDVIEALKDYSAGDTATLTVSRNDQTITLEITFDEKIPESANEPN